MNKSKNIYSNVERISPFVWSDKTVFPLYPIQHSTFSIQHIISLSPMMMAMMILTIYICIVWVQHPKTNCNVRMLECYQHRQPSTHSPTEWAQQRAKRMSVKPGEKWLWRRFILMMNTFKFFSFEKENSTLNTEHRTQRTIASAHDMTDWRQWFKMKRKREKKRVNEKEQWPRWNG